MSNLTALQGACLAPFLDASMFPVEGGYVAGRFCAAIGQIPGDPTCCLPCPSTDWAYADSFNSYNIIAGWLNAAGLVLLTFMLLSYVVLPAQKTRRHYLSVCLIIAVIMIAIGFIIPLAAKPSKCYNEITPNDMYSSHECAWSGSFIIAGAICAIVWIFIRALSMNLQICWDIIPGRKFFYCSQAFGWGVPAILFTATLTVTGVSFRFGDACHVNHDKSLADFWGPLLAFAAMAVLLQLATFGYCIHVYLKNLWIDEPATSTNASGSGLPSYSSSLRTQQAVRAVYQRIKRVLWLQWRGLSIVSIMLVDVIFFAIVFVYLDDLQASATTDIASVEPWLLCLVLAGGDKNQCLDLVSNWLVNEPTAVAVLLLLSCTGIQVFFLLFRPSLFSGWADYFREKFISRQEFVSLDALPQSRQGVNRSVSKQELLKYPVQGTTFEMQRPKDLSLDIDMKNSLSPADTSLSSPEEIYKSPTRYGRETPDSGGVTPTSILKSRVPAEYVGVATPDAASLSRATSPPVGYNSKQSTNDYFGPADSRGSTSQRAVANQRPIPNRSESRSSRLYQTPTESFSSPTTPNRQSSSRSARSVNWDPREMYGRGGLCLNPPSEAGESKEDLTEGHR